MFRLITVEASEEVVADTRILLRISSLEECKSRMEGEYQRAVALGWEGYLTPDNPEHSTRRLLWKGNSFFSIEIWDDVDNRSDRQIKKEMYARQKRRNEMANLCCLGHRGIYSIFPKIAIVY